MAARIVESITSFTDARGLWHARVTFEHTLSESDPREQYNLAHRLPNIRRRAKRAIVEEIAHREQKTYETWSHAVRRIEKTLRVEIVEQNIDAQNRWHGITFKES